MAFPSPGHLIKLLPETQSPVKPSLVSESRKWSRIRCRQTVLGFVAVLKVRLCRHRLFGSAESFVWDGPKCLAPLSGSSLSSAAEAINSQSEAAV